MPRFLVCETGTNTVNFPEKKCSRYANKDSRKGSHAAELGSVFIC